MKKYKYTAFNLEKKKFTGVFLAENEEELSRRLAEQGLYLVKAAEVKATTVNTFFTVSGRVTVYELAAFCRQFSIMVTSGIPIVQALDILRTQSYSGLLKKTLNFVQEDVESGSLLSKAMEKHKKVFPRFFCSMIHVGEIGGMLDKILVTLADYLESDARIRKKAKNAMRYPTFLIVFAIAVIALIVAFIIPAFMSTLDALEVEMPSITLGLYQTGLWIRKNWIFLLVGIFAAVMLFLLLIHTRKGKYIWHMFLYRAPLLRKINGSLVTARFARSFGLLIEGGSDVIDALETVVAVLNNRYVEEKLKAAINDIRQGMSVSASLGNHKVFPKLILQMIAVGEQTGNLAETLLRACPFFETEAEESVSRLLNMIQPAIIFVIGVSVGLLFYIVYSPLLQIMNNLGT